MPLSVTTGKVVLDANVLVPPTLRSTLLIAAEHDLFQPKWSAEILGEVTRVLRRRFGVDTVRLEYLISQMRAAFPDAEVSGYEALVPHLTNDPGDRHVLAAAIVSKSSTIVTFNRRHFPRQVIQPLGIAVQLPDELLVGLLEADPEAMRNVVDEHVRSLTRPPKTLAEVLEALRSHAPRFVERFASRSSH